MRWYHSGRFWMTLWIGISAIMFAWGIGTVLFWADSTRNINYLSVAANLLAPLAGFQASLAMRKADNHDRF